MLHWIFYLNCIELQVPPSWCNNHAEAWEKMVDRWCSPEWQERHNIHRDRRLKMAGPSHHQGSRDLTGYAKAWVSGFNCLF